MSISTCRLTTSKTNLALGQSKILNSSQASLSCWVEARRNLMMRWDPTTQGPPRPAQTWRQVSRKEPVKWNKRLWNPCNYRIPRRFYLKEGLKPNLRPPRIFQFLVQLEISNTLETYIRITCRDIIPAMAHLNQI